MYGTDPLSWLDIHTILIFAVIFLVFCCGIKQRKNLPPGPWNFPLIGCFPSLAVNLYRTGDDPEQLLAKMAGRYGEVFCMNIGTKVIVVLNGYKSIKEAFLNPRLNDRPRSRLLEETTLDKGVAIASGKLWTHQRKFTTSTLRSLGVGKGSFEEQISAEAETLIHAISHKKRKRFDPRTLVANCVLNIVCSVVFGKRYHHSDPKFEYILALLTTLVNKMGSGAIFMFLPIMRYFLPQGYTELKSCIQEFVMFVKNKAKEHEEVFDGTNVEDLMDVFLREIKLSNHEDGDRSDYINNKSLVATSAHLFAAGVETATTTLGWALLYMITYPEIQAKVQEEIDEVVGRQRMPKWNDRSDLPYTEAVLFEIQRIRTVVPLGVPHLASKDTKIAGYHIPKDALIVSNLWAAHNDPDVWPEPHQFNPKRFLDQNGLLRTREEFMPFSTGRRVCLGEHLAKMQVFIFFTYILHSFIIKPPHGSQSQPHSLKGTGGMSFGPLPYEIIAENR